MSEESPVSALSDRMRRQIDRLLDEADEAARALDWETVRARARAVLNIDPGNGDALAYVAAAQRDELADGAAGHEVAGPPLFEAVPSEPKSFVSGRYQVVRFLGEGAAKRVYLAHDTKLDRDVAFALIKTDGLDTDGLTRIRREAQAMARLGDHPHVVTVHDIGEENGQPYIVSQFMAGGDLVGLIAAADERRVPIADVVRLANHVCQALEHAHAQGIVHRDLKPGNVWLDASGAAKLGDFGLALSLDRSRLTQAGLMVGTVAYMAPEQALGGEVTPRSDLYSLGAVLYELVTGRPPFVGDESVAIITQHLNTPPVAPSWHNPETPPGLETLILRLLEKDPAKRPASATEVRAALANVADGAQGVAARPAAFPDGSPDPLYSRTFVGREPELRQLQGAFDAALSGQGSLGMVVGEPGIGKTSICEQLVTYVAVRGGRGLVGHCYEEGSLSLPYLPFVEAMRTYVLASEPEDLKKHLGSGASEVARIVSEVRDKLQVSPSEGGDPDEQRWRLLQAVTGFLRNASSVQPLLMVLEDLHDADKGTLDLLLHLSRNLQGARLMLVGTYRDVEVDRSHPLSSTLAELRRAASFLRVPLRGLTVDEVQRMISNIRGQDVSWSRAELYHRQTEGNPLFVQEVLRYLVEEGLVVREGGRYGLVDPSAAEAGIPEGLRDVIGKRLSRLSADCNRLLAIAAVIGRDFDLQTLRTVAGFTEDALLMSIEEAVRVGVLEERSQPGRVTYRFAHAFFRQTLYEEMIAPRRLHLHQEVARALEAQYGSRREEHAAELAEHFAQSTDRADLKKAVEYGELAAHRAMSVFAYGEAARHLERCLAVQEVLDPDDTAKRCDLLLALGEALLRAGEPLRAAEQIAPQALSLAEAASDTVQASRACQIALEGVFRYGGALLNTSPVFRRWAELADRYATPGTLARVHADTALAQLHSGLGQRAEASALSRAALELARRLDEPDTLFFAAFLDHNISDSAQEGLRFAEEFTTRPHEGVGAANLGRVLFFSGMTFLAWGERPKAEAAWQRIAELGTRTRDVDPRIYALRTEAILATLDGRLEAGAAAAEGLVALGDELGSPVAVRHFAAATPMRALLYLGRAEEAWARLGQSSQALAQAGRAVDAENRNRLAVPAVCLAHLGRRAEAQAALDQALAEPQRDVDAGGLLLEIAVLLGNREAATLLMSQLDSAAASRLHSTNGGPTSIARHLGAAAALLGMPQEARAYYHQALEVCERVRFRPEIALTKLQLAELLLQEHPGDRTEGREHLDFAITEFEAMKMAPSLGRAMALRESLA